ncbi:aldo/keto reductase [Nakamurella lactea]|uniref:aldo/keto reductase n=1 Tax=Nakamurella lactea TaxID=459515 RepID=UPI0003F8C857|nr:aldo/keto reductase [Nakamurella lactea]
MEYRQLGRSGLKVSVLTLGTMGFGGAGGFSKVGSLDVADAKSQVDLCLDAGVNLIDTADMYSAGLSEEIVGQVLRGRRDEVLLTTKVRFTMGEGPNDAGLSRHHIIRGCEASLRRLGTDYLDLYQLHERDGVTPVEETLEALDLLVAQGKVRYVGASNFAAWQMMKYLGVAERDRLPRFVSQQIHYSLLSRDAEYELIPMSIDEGIGNLIWSPLGGGMLTGKYRRGGTDETVRYAELNASTEPPVHDPEQLYDLVEVIAAVAGAHEVSLAQVSLAYLLDKPGVSSIVIAGRTQEQLADNLAALDLTLSDDDVAQLDAASALRPIYPFWHQAATASDRLSAGDLTLLQRYL